MSDPVNHPAHYTTGKIEVIDFIEDKELGFHLGNAVKYIARAGKKDPAKTVEDLQKAAWYLNREIMRSNEHFRKCGNCRFDKAGICYRNGYKQEQPAPGVCIRFAPIERKEIQDENN